MSQGNPSTQRLLNGSQSLSSTTNRKATASSQAPEEYLLPLSALRNNQTWLILSGRKISAQQATSQELERFFENAVNVINQKARPWSIFIRWHALNRGIIAGTLRVSQEDDHYSVSKTEEKASAQEGQERYEP